MQTPVARWRQRVVFWANVPIAVETAKRTRSHHAAPAGEGSAAGAFADITRLSAAVVGRFGAGRFGSRECQVLHARLVAVTLAKHVAVSVATVITCRPDASTRPDPRPRASADRELDALIDEPWVLRVGHRPLLVRPGTARDLTAVARMHGRCSPRSLLDRYRRGGRPPAIAALDASLRRRYGIVAVTVEGDVVAHGTLAPDGVHNYGCAEVGLLVEDRWQHLGIGTELLSHLAGVAQLAGDRELIAYPATALGTVQRLMIGLGRTRRVPGTDLHLHTLLPKSAALGIGSVRQRLAG